MNEFYKALTYVNKLFYEPNHFTIHAIREEAQNSDYGAGIFQLHSKSIRFRVAKITPNKIGQFVAFWEKDGNDKNQAFSYEKATDLLVINTFTNHNKFGQFVFPKEVLVKQNILKTATTKGKMGIRVYPRWETPTSKQAIETQKWQLAYFVEVNNTNRFSVRELLKLYSN
ncbi:MepB family protein [Bacillus vallismortis]|uniref:MepB family protein n=1 Tax=Bacillus vallismortis TaxID=72361 RepID=A0AAP3CFJ8_BACVA|nr:MepB family protein [Bacillus vallismortis]MCY8315611.1 MepB family protein [Bacillus vallismortis]MEC1790614.1 MepB family protein [Bacillus vallismortis]